MTEQRTDHSAQNQAITVALVQPTEPGNVGAAARALSAFGFADLLLIEPAYRDVARDFTFAVRSGRQLLEQTRQIPLAQAESELALYDEVWGTSSRDGHRRRNEAAAPAIADYLAHNLAGSRGRLLILFGPERDGLSLDWLDRCHRLINLPTCGGSLNLAQAVNIIAYELRRQLNELTAPGNHFAPSSSNPHEPIESASIEPVSTEMRREILNRIDRILSELEYPTRVLPGHSPEIYLEPLRSGQFTQQQARWLMGLLTRLVTRLEKRLTTRND